MSEGPVGALYLHVPLCRARCRYCDFCSRPSPEGDPARAACADALLADLAAAGEAGLLAGVRTAYVGGGTPSLLGTAALARLASAVRERCPRVSELTVEANPESLAEGMPEALADAGATRLSLGVQSLDDAELAALGRVHDAACARRALRRAAAAGLDVSADVMCAIPLQTERSLRATLAGVLACGAGHVSVYPLQLEEGTELERMVGAGEAEVADADGQARLMEAACDELSRAGLRRYEVASYALPGRECRHNEAYWTGVPYLGLGASAASMLDAEAYRLARGLVPRLPEAPADAARVRLVRLPGADPARVAPMAEAGYDLEFLDARQAAAEDLMLAARMSAPLPAGLLARAAGAVGEGELSAALGRLVARGLLDGVLAPTHDGWLLGNELYGELWGLAGSPTAEARVGAAGL